MKLSKYILASSLTLAMSLGFTSCDKEEFSDSIFPDVPTEADPSSATYKFDTWLNQNFRDVYNMEFVYRMRDVETDYDYNLTPAKLENAMKMAVLLKYVWYDAYAEAYGGSLATPDPTFVRQVGPKMISLIGSSMYNTNGSETLGYATGGVKIVLTNVNNANFGDIQELNNRYFHTMHHEYTHILHQTRNYPTEFNLLSNGRYDDSHWQERNGGVCASLGFVTPYSSANYTEDFAEVVSNYITRTDEDYEMLYWCAKRGWDAGDDELDQSHAYCYYYYQTEEDQANDNRTCILYYDSDPQNTSIKLRERYIYNDQRYTYEYRGKTLSSVAEVEAYLEELEASLRNEYMNNQAKSRFGVAYSALDAEQKAIIEGLADQKVFIYPANDVDTVDGYEIMQRKLDICRAWFRDSWGLDLDNLRKIVQRRSADYNLPALMQEIYDIEIPNRP